jgi:hypothetical protein
MKIYSAIVELQRKIGTVLIWVSAREVARKLDALIVHGLA